MFGEEPQRTLLIVVAALNEEQGIKPTIVELRDYLENPRILVVDGHSQDRTREAARSLNAEVVVQKGRGKGDAISQALQHITPDVDFVVFTDADFTYPAEYLPKMIKILEKNPRIGMVCGNRFNSHFHLNEMNNLFYIGNRMLAFTHNILNGIALRDPLTGLRVVRAKLLRNWSPSSKGFDIEVELNHLIERRGYGISEIPINYRQRIGEKKLKLRHGTTILKRIILESTVNA